MVVIEIATPTAAAARVSKASMPATPAANATMTVLMSVVVSVPRPPLPSSWRNPAWSRTTPVIPANNGRHHEAGDQRHRGAGDQPPAPAGEADADGRQRQQVG